MSRRSQLDHHLYASKFEVTPSSIERYAEYRWAASICEGLKVLDFGCNTGFGSELISQQAASVHGIDVVQEAIRVAKTEFANRDNLEFELVPEDPIPNDLTNFQATTAFNIIEHFPNPNEKLRQMHGTLAKNGRLLVTTVNRELRLYPWQRPWNDLHHIEFSPDSLKRMVSKYFSDVVLMGLHFNGPFFPDLVSGASRRKFQIAIEYPVRNLLRKTVRPLLSTVLPSRFKECSSATPAHAELNETENASTTLTLEDAYRQIVINDDIKDCVKILAIATK